jgi:hypothetical protein
MPKAVRTNTTVIGSTHHGNLLQADDIADKLVTPSRYLQLLVTKELCPVSSIEDSQRSFCESVLE